jgi:multiple sugar transport system ATP-binding protein
MKDGYIQQVDSPQKLFDAPCNMFVAGFIGSPQMNFIDGELIRDGEKYYLETTGADGGKADKHYLPAGKINGKLSDYSGKSVTLGIRPEDIHDDEQSLANEDFSVIDAVVEVRELMGSEVYLYLKYGEKPLMARVPTSAASISSGGMKVAIDMNKVHLFDQETELAIFN